MRVGGTRSTAVFVCQGRAIASGLLPPSDFRDDLSARLLLEGELAEVRAARQSHPPSDISRRLRWGRLRACAEIMVPRTLAIDAVLAEAEPSQLVIVGAGLDSRPWRLDALADADIYLVDHPDTEAETRVRTLTLTPVTEHLAWTPVDLAAEPLAPALAHAGFDEYAPSVWLWEGVIPFLSVEEVNGVLRQIAALATPGSALVATYEQPRLSARLGRILAKLSDAVTGETSPLAEEPRRSHWTDAAMGEALARHGFDVHSDETLLQIARRVGSPSSQSEVLRSERVVTAVRSPN